MFTSNRIIKFFLVISALQLLFGIFLFIGSSTPNGDKIMRGVFGMGLGLYVFWIIIGGLLMVTFKDKIKNFVIKIPLYWQLKFVIFCTILAMIEEAITVGLTNTAPLFGLKVGEAYITVSANYWDVVLGHSVIVFVPFFIAWAWLLSRYDFNAKQVFLLFGLAGTLAEAIGFGLQHIAEIGMWMFVYGLMIYLPAYCIPEDRPVVPPKFRHYILSLIAPFVFQVLLVLVLPLIKNLRPSVNNVFPPMNK